VKRSLATATGVVVLLASAVGAQATANVDSGKYKGKTGTGNKITFRVTASKRLVHFRHTHLKLNCSDNTSFHIENPDTLDSGKKKLHILDNGRFAFTVRYDNGGKWKATGRIKGRKAKGTLKMTVRFRQNADGSFDADPNGKIRCSSGKLHWKAKHPHS
jgi:opacity protein-like surface antigen